MENQNICLPALLQENEILTNVFGSGLVVGAVPLAIAVARGKYRYVVSKGDTSVNQTEGVEVSRCHRQSEIDVIISLASCLKASWALS